MPTVIPADADARLERRTGSPEGLARRIAELERRLSRIDARQAGSMRRLNNLVQSWDDTYRVVIHGPYLPMFSFTSVAAGGFNDQTFTHNLDIPNADYTIGGSLFGAAGTAVDRLQYPQTITRTANAITVRVANSWTGAVSASTFDGFIIARYAV